MAPGTESPDSQQEPIGQTPPRLSLTDGQVSFWRPGAEDWSEAQVNTPLAPGDRLYTGPQGSLEIQTGSRAFVRTGGDTQLAMESHEPDFVQFKVTAGRACLDLRTVDSGRTVEVDTPNGAFTIEHAGYYRLDVTDTRTSFIARRGGQATVTSAGGQRAGIASGEEVVIEGEEGAQVSWGAAPQLDPWDEWNYARTRQLLDPVSASYLPPGIYGVEDLDRSGTWKNAPTYGAVWVPRGVPAGWAPYSTGAWVSDPVYGWTWVDTAPWGWAPYHYGRWVHVNGYWAWAPGPPVARPVYAPALVAFFSGSGVRVGVGVGRAPGFGWVALGWGEPCVPCWGPRSFRHRPWWGGWGGPRVVNKMVIQRTTVVHVQEIKTYRNAEVPHAMLVVGEGRFGRGPVKAARVTKAHGKDLRPMHAAPQIALTPASYVPREKPGIRPSENILKRAVVATRRVQPEREIPAAAVSRSAPVRVPTPAPRIVSAPPKGERVRQRAPSGTSDADQRTTDRARPVRPTRLEDKRRPERASRGAPSVPAQRSPQGQQALLPNHEASAPQPGHSHRREPAHLETEKRPEKAATATQPVNRQATPPRQRGQQAVLPTPRPEPSTRRPETDRSRQPSHGKETGRTEDGNKAQRSVTTRTAPPKYRAQQAAGGELGRRERQAGQSSRERPQTFGRPAEETSRSPRVLSAKGANDSSPNRSRTNRRNQQKGGT